MADPGNLYIRWSETGSDDNRTDPGAATWYLSASLKIIHPQGANQDEGLADTGVAQKIRVLVDTKATTTNVVVQVWVCAWGTAGQPFLPSAGGVQGLRADHTVDPNGANQPLTASPAPPAAQLSVDLPWKPLNTDLTAIGEPLTADLHVCLLANCYSTAGAGDGAQLFPANQQAFDVPHNRHQAQRNIKLHPVTNAMGQMKIPMFAGNPFAEGEDVFELQAEETIRPELAKDDLQHLQRGRWLRDDDELPGRGARLQFADERLPEIALAIGGEKPRSGPVKAELTAGKPQKLELDVAVPEAEPGTLHVLDVVQRRGGKEVVGGGRILLLTVDEKRYAALHQPGKDSSYE
jgi:hypothetical protein